MLSTQARLRAHSCQMRIATRSLFALLAATVLAVVGPVPSPSDAKPATTRDRAGTSVGVMAAHARIDRRVSLTLGDQDCGPTASRCYYYSAWGTNNKLTVTLVEGRLYFRDPRPTGWERLGRACRRVTVDRGVAASCRVPDGVSAGHPLELSLELRLGNDSVNMTTLGAEFYGYVLADQGTEVIKLGAGDDWVNGFLGPDEVWGGDGDDFMRGGEGNDILHGEAGKDELVGLEGDDKLYGGQGVDQIKCGDGNNDLAEPDDSDSIVAGCEGTTV